MMHHIPQDFKNARILVTNDDGVHAKGISILEQVARSLSDDVWVVAPQHEQSGVGHSITLHDPLRVRQLEEKRFSTSGTPTDCVLLAAREIIPNDKPISLVLSGINRGMNIADDVTYSGTVAGAMEGTLLDIPSIAFSQSRRDEEHRVDEANHIHWETAERYTKEVLLHLRGLEIPKHTFLSVNFPNVAPKSVQGMVASTLGRRKIVDKLDRRIDPKGRTYYWIGNVGFQSDESDPDSDIEQLRKQFVTITPVDMDMTNHGFMFALNERMQG